MLPAGIKKDLMSEEACQVFEDQVARLLKAGRHDPRVAKLATQALRAARKRYRHGVTSVLEVLNAQAALVRARAQQVDASRRWMLACLNLAYAVGDLRTLPGLFGARALDAPQLGAR